MNYLSIADHSCGWSNGAASADQTAYIQSDPQTRDCGGTTKESDQKGWQEKIHANTSELTTNKDSP